jgi:DNA-binding protein YbaB
MNPELIRLIESNEIQIHGDVEYFAELVAAAEREACAKVCERLPAQQDIDVRDQCAAAIRARGQA